nr:butyrophilin subfamily 3 member A1-like [Anolis sagrei ordinatus]
MVSFWVNSPRMGLGGTALQWLRFFLEGCTQLVKLGDTCPVANVILDPDTSGSHLILSEDRKSVGFGNKREDLPDNPERFSDRTFVLGCEGFTRGRHFWEVAVGTEGTWSMGVARRSVRRKGIVNIRSSEGIWTVDKRKGIYPVTSHLSSSPLSLSEKTKKVRVYLNCAANRMAFYDADTGDQIQVFSDVSFIGETVLPFFYLGIDSHLKISP